MKRSEMVSKLVRIHTELGPLGMSLESKCNEILSELEELGIDFSIAGEGWESEDA